MVGLFLWVFSFTDVLCTDFALFAQHLHEVGYLGIERLLNFDMKMTLMLDKTRVAAVVTG